MICGLGSLIRFARVLTRDIWMLVTGGDPGITRTRSRKMLLKTRKREFRDYAAAQIAVNLPHCDPLGGSPVKMLSSPSLPAFENTGDNWVFGKGKHCNYFTKSSNPSIKITLIKWASSEAYSIIDIETRKLWTVHSATFWLVILWRSRHLPHHQRSKTLVKIRFMAETKTATLFMAE